MLIGYLKGTVIETREGSVLLDVGGIGYIVEIPSNALRDLPPSGNEIKLYTEMIIRDDRMNLYGFLDSESLMVFKVLLEVSGVGPRLAMNILSVLNPDDLISDISKAETARIRSVHGVGKKTAARICVDLKEKASKILVQKGDRMSTRDGAQVAMHEGSQAFEDAVSALVNLGYRPEKAKRVISEILQEGSNVEIHELIKRGLGRLSGVR